ncbi:MAG: peptidylprolyl isomerase [Gallionella sp.]
MSINSRIILASAVALLTLSACHKNSNNVASSAKTGEIAATVNGTPISKDSVDQVVMQQSTMGQADTPETRKAIINKLAMQMLVAQEATQKNLDKTPAIADQLKLTRQSILANAFVEDYVKNNPISDDVLKAEYDKIKPQLSGSEYKARHILVASEAEARNIIAKLKANAAQFDKLAKELSKDSGSRAQGGELGWFDARNMVPEFAAAVAKLEKGKFTLDPVKTQFGYHVILLEESRSKEAPTLEQIKPQLSKQVQEQNLRKLLDSMMAKAKIEITAASAVAPVAK